MNNLYNFSNNKNIPTTAPYICVCECVYVFKVLHQGLVDECHQSRVNFFLNKGHNFTAIFNWQPTFPLSFSLNIETATVMMYFIGEQMIRPNN